MPTYLIRLLIQCGIFAWFALWSEFFLKRVYSASREDFRKRFGIFLYLVLVATSITMSDRIPWHAFQWFWGIEVVVGHFYLWRLLKNSGIPTRPRARRSSSSRW